MTKSLLEMAPNAEKNENSEKTQQDSNEQTTKNKVIEFDCKSISKSVVYTMRRDFLNSKKIFSRLKVENSQTRLVIFANCENSEMLPKSLSGALQSYLNSLISVN